MSIVTYNNRSIANISAIPGAAKSLTLIKTLTASSSSTLSFINGSDDVVLDSTYPIYLFKYIGIHPATNDANFNVNFRDGGSSYDATKTSTFFRVFNEESGTDDSGLSYYTSGDVAQGTGVQLLSYGVGSDNDQCTSGEMYLFNPSSTTFVKHFMSRSNTAESSDHTWGGFMAGYCNVTAAIDAVQFSFSSGNIDAGTVKLYGLKDS
jgi:hypothetical protein